MRIGRVADRAEQLGEPHHRDAAGAIVHDAVDPGVVPRQ